MGFIGLATSLSLAFVAQIGKIHFVHQLADVIVWYRLANVTIGTDWLTSLERSCGLQSPKQGHNSNQPTGLQIRPLLASFLRVLMGNNRFALLGHVRLSCPAVVTSHRSAPVGM